MFMRGKTEQELLYRLEEPTVSHKNSKWLRLATSAFTIQAAQASPVRAADTGFFGSARWQVKGFTPAQGGYPAKCKAEERRRTKVYVGVPQAAARQSRWTFDAATDYLLCQCVGKILLPQHTSFPRGDLRHHIRQQPQGIIRREYGDAEHVAHRNQDEEVLHTGPGLQGEARGIMRCHAIHKFLYRLEDATLLLFLIVFRHASHSPY